MAAVIETERLRLRQWTSDDIEPWVRMNADPRVMEFFVSTTPPERSRELAALLRQDIEQNGYGWFVMERKDLPGFAGVIAVDDIRYEVPFEPRREIGWRLPVESWGHGYATEAASAAMEFAFRELRWPEIIAMTTVKNVRSRRVMEKLGMSHDPAEDFEHPRVPDGHPIKLHVLYRKSATTPR
jgi:3-dehydroquinate dehydratase/shikimate dehydrogenase